MLGLISDILYPPRCRVCSTLIGKVDIESHRVGYAPRSSYRACCLECDPFLKMREDQRLLFSSLPHCVMCGEPALDTDNPDEQRCNLCVYDSDFRARSIWRYAGVVEKLIKSYKYAGEYGLRYFLADCLRIALTGTTSGINPAFDNSNWNLIVPAPSSHLSLINRGFHHMAAITSLLAADLQIECNPTALSFCHNRPNQASLPIERRMELSSRHINVTGVKGRRILLVDDVVTTGSTLLAISRALKRKGAHAVDGISLARSERFPEFFAKILSDSKGVGI